jgi:hypothetical protein
MPQSHSLIPDWGIGASVGLHLLVALMVVLLPTPFRPQPPDEGIAVEIVSPDRLAPAGTPRGTQARSDAAAEAGQADRPAAKQSLPAMTAPATPGKAPPAMVEASEMLSAKALAAPGSRKALQAMAELAGSEQVVQLCDIEAMEQIHKWKAEFRPDLVIAYAMAGAKVTSHSVEADGAAFRSNKRWYNIRFRCEVAPDLGGVVSFAFLVGDEIPQREWQDHYLTADDGSAD